jgi:hypothetical protein
MTDPETIDLRVTQIARQRCVDDFTVFWRGMPIGRIMKVSKGSGGRWWWGCNVYDRVSLANDSGDGNDLDDCKAKFLIAWTRIRAELTNEDIARAYRLPQH